MNKSHPSPAWLVYERCVAAFVHERYGAVDIVVQPNTYLIGSFSKTRRQIDVLIDARWETGVGKRIIVDAKERKRKIDVKDIDSLIGMMQDCRANKAVIVTTSGFTEAAKRRAEDAVDIHILPLDVALEYDWVFEPCLGDCRHKFTKTEGMVLWAEQILLGLRSGFWLTVQTGKCDSCHNFHVWCWDCGERFAVPNEHVITCSCGYQWASVMESLESGHTGVPTSIWLLMREDNDPSNRPIPVDRKPLR